MERWLKIGVAGNKIKLDTNMTAREAVIILDEALHEAIKREFREEAGLIVKPH